MVLIQRQMSEQSKKYVTLPCVMLPCLEYRDTVPSMLIKVLAWFHIVIKDRLEISIGEVCLCVDLNQGRLRQCVSCEVEGCSQFSIAQLAQSVEHRSS